MQTLVKAVKLVTPRGIVNLNTNGFSSERIENLRDAGLDSIRISMNSPDRNRYNQYYRPKGYKFEDVMDSVRTAKKIGLFTSINYLVFPGYTDCEEESRRSSISLPRPGSTRSR
jgi:molybdenum cofactor biosynthesis enzyme MoaA